MVIDVKFSLGSSLYELLEIFFFCAYVGWWFFGHDYSCLGSHQSTMYKRLKRRERADPKREVV